MRIRFGVGHEVMSCSHRVMGLVKGVGQWSMTNAMVTHMRSLGRSSGYIWCQSLQAITQEYELLGDLKQSVSHHLQG